MSQGFPNLNLHPRWAPGLAVPMLVMGLLLATMCSAQCLGQHCDAPAPAEAAEHHHSAPVPEPTPGHSPDTPENGDCAGHGSGDFLAQASSSALKLRLDYSWAAAAVPVVSPEGILSGPSLTVATLPAETHSPPPISRAATPLRI